MSSVRLQAATAGALAAALMIPLSAHAQTENGVRARFMIPKPGMEDTATGAKVFKCDNGQDLVAKFDTQNATLVAVVDVGQGPVLLPLRPFDGGEPRITWSDGPRTLTWNTGVRLMYTEGATHLMCGRGETVVHHNGGGS